MAEQNRVRPDGSIVAVAGRGTWMGNRGRLHEGHEIVRPWRLNAWIVCRLSFRDRRVQQWSPTHYTPLFFFDEAVAFAAGHRPCGECRRAEYLAYRNAAGVATVAELDRRLNGERRAGATRVDWLDVPDGAFVRTPDGPALALDDALVAWDDAAYGYGAAVSKPRAGRAEVLTPPTTVEVLRAGGAVHIHEDATAALQPG